MDLFGRAHSDGVDKLEQIYDGEVGATLLLSFVVLVDVCLSSHSVSLIKVIVVIRRRWRIKKAF